MSKRGSKNKQYKRNLIKKYGEIERQIERLHSTKVLPEAYSMPTVSENASMSELRERIKIGESILAIAAQEPLMKVSGDMTSQEVKNLLAQSMLHESYGKSRQNLIRNLERLHEAQEKGDQKAIEELYAIIWGGDDNAYQTTKLSNQPL